MKSLKDILYVVVILAVIFFEGYYLFTVYKEDKAQIASNKEEIARVDLQIQQLEKRLARHKESQKELEQLKKQKTAMLDTIPDEENYMKYINQVYNYFSLLDCYEVGIESIGNEMIDNDMGKINKHIYKVTFVNTYEKSRNLVDSISGMYQAANVSSYAFDTKVQGEQPEQNRLSIADVYGDEVYQVGETTFQFEVFYRYDENVGDEYFQPGISMQTNENPFEYVRSDGALATQGSIPVNNNQENDQVEETETPVSDEVQVEGTNQKILNSSAAFQIDITDALTSGDTYMVSGPGSMSENYVGIVSSANGDITVEVFKDHYKLVVKDANGQVEETTVECAINQPILSIISTMRQVTDVMPSVHIHVINHTGENMEVILQGTLLDNIHIFNENNEEVTKGQTKGSISLT